MKEFLRVGALGALFLLPAACKIQVDGARGEESSEDYSEWVAANHSRSAESIGGLLRQFRGEEVAYWQSGEGWGLDLGAQADSNNAVLVEAGDDHVLLRDHRGFQVVLPMTRLVSIQRVPESVSEGR